MTRPIKRSFAIRGHRTSISLEEPFWEAFREIAADRRESLATLVARIDSERPVGTGLSTAVRLFVLAALRARAALDTPAGGPTKLNTDKD
ncbi:MAG: ribbon-helix-helix domain-containing protein [Hyphomicrobiaceae bacterium]